MPRTQRVKDDELENEQLKDMLGDGVEDNDNELSGDEGDGGSEDDETSDDDKDGGDKEGASGEQDGSRRGRSDATDRNSQRGNNQRQPNDKRNSRSQQEQQQTQNRNSVLQTLKPDVQKAVMQEAIAHVRQRTQTVFNKLDMDVRKLNEQLNVHKQASADAAKYGLQPHERTTGYRMFAAFKKDPLATIKELMTQAKKQGLNVDMGADANSIDMRAIQGMINEALGPVRGEFEQRQEQQRGRAEAQEMLVNFYAKEPDAQTHEPLINGILQRYPDETLETAWLKVKLHAAQNGLDLSKPLNMNQRREQQQQGNGNRRPMIQRGVRMQQNNGRDQSEGPQFADPNAKWGDIIKDSMRAEGIEI